MFQVVKFKTQAAWRGQGGGWWGDEGGNKKIVLIFSFNLELGAPDMVWQSVCFSCGEDYILYWLPVTSIQTLAPHLLLLLSFLLLRGVEAPEAAATAELLFLCWTLRTNQR